MRRSQLIAALRQVLEAGGDRTDMLVVVRLRDGDGMSLGHVGVFGDVENGQVASEMLRQAWAWTEREGRPLDSSGVILAALKAPEPGEQPN